MIKTQESKKGAVNKRSRTFRKTITLDGDLAQEISAYVIERGSSEKIVINSLLRIGLIHEKSAREERPTEFVLPSFPKGIGDISRQELNAMLDEA